MLPKEKIKATRKNPKRLIIYGKPKIGKTTALAQLPDTLLLDLENGSDHVDAMKVNILGLYPPPKEPKEDARARAAKFNYYLSEFKILIGRELKKNGKFPYKRLAVDTLSKIEEWAEEEATLAYMDSPIGAKFNRDPKTLKVLDKSKWASVLSLPRGAGYFWLRVQVIKILNDISELAEDVIFICHVKNSSIEKNGKELMIEELDLTGKISTIVAASSDAIGYMHRYKDATYLNFDGKGSDAASTRCAHLQGQNIKVMEKNAEGEIVSYWDSIYLPDEK